MQKYFRHITLISILIVLLIPIRTDAFSLKDVSSFFQIATTRIVSVIEHGVSLFIAQANPEAPVPVQKMDRSPIPVSVSVSGGTTAPVSVSSPTVIYETTYPQVYVQGLSEAEIDARLARLWKEVDSIPRVAQRGGVKTAIYQGVEPNTYGISGDQVTIRDVIYKESGTEFKSDLFFVDTNNNRVGIGTTSPFAKFSVTGNMVLTGAFYDANSSAGVNGYVLQTTGSGTQWVATSSLGLSSGGSSSFVGLSDTQSSLSARRIIFTSSDATTLTDNASFVFDGTNFGVGTTSPGYMVGVGGTLGVTGTTNLATTTITGLLTINGNTNITEGGELTVGDKVISEGEIGAGTSTPYAKLSIQNTTTAQTAFGIYGVASQSAPLFDIYNNPTSNTNLFRITADGKVGIGTVNPTQALDVTGNLNVSAQAYFGHENGIRLNSRVWLRPTEQGRLVIFNNSGNDFDRLQFGGTSSAYPSLKRSAAELHIRLADDSDFGGFQANQGIFHGNLGIGTTSPFAKLSVHANNGETNASLFSVASSTASATTTHFTILNDGKVGINVAQPANRLDVSVGNDSTFGYALRLRNGFGGDFTTTGVLFEINNNIAKGALVYRKVGGWGRGDFHFLQNTTANSDSPTINDSVLTITNSGNLGIGTTSPYAKLSVVGETVSEYFTATSTTATSTFAGGLNVGSGGLVYDHQTGNVGIGTDTPNESLDVVGSVQINGLLTVNYNNSAESGYFAKTSTSFDITNGYDDLNLLANGDFNFQTYVGGWNTVLTLKEEGNLGIGTTSPYAKLSVVGETVSEYFTATSTTATSTFAGGLVAGNSSFNVLQNGNVGIGTTSPAEQLTLTGNLKMPVTTAGAGIIYANTNRFIHNYADEDTNGGNTFLGVNAGNLTIGSSAGNPWEGSTNVGIGASALIALTTGYSNTAIGSSALGDITSGNQNVGIGVSTLTVNAANSSQNVAIGSGAGVGACNASLTSSIFIGYSTGTGCGGASNVIAIGYDLTVSGSNLLNIGNLIFGTGLGSGSTMASGNLGIGTTTPFARFSVKGAGTTTGVNFQTTNSSDAPLFTILDSGKVGIGTSTPEYLLDVNGITRVTDGIKFGNSIEASGLYTYSDAIQIKKGNNTFASFNGNAGITLVADKYFGIGDNGAQTRLHADADHIFAQRNLTNAQEFRLYNTNNGSNDEFASLGWINNSNVFGIETEATGSGTVRNIALLGGNLGLGTTTPAYKLDVYSTGDNDVASFTDTNGVCTINPTSTALSCSSDRTLKKDIESLDQFALLDKVSELNTVSYRWKTEDGSQPIRLGFIAQDVEDIFPEFVTEGPNGKKAVSYGSFTPVLASAIQAIHLDVMATSTVLDSGRLSMVGRIMEYLDSLGIKLSATVAQFKNIWAEEVKTEKLCVGDTCITSVELKELLDQHNVQQDNTLQSFDNVPDEEDKAGEEDGEQDTETGETDDNTDTIGGDIEDEETAEVADEDTDTEAEESTESSEDEVSEEGGGDVSNSPTIISDSHDQDETQDTEKESLTQDEPDEEVETVAVDTEGGAEGENSP